MRRWRVGLLGFGLALFLNLGDAHAVRGWLGGNWGASYDEFVKGSMAIGPTVAFVVGKHFFFGGRMEFYVNMDEEDDKDQSIYAFFDNQRFLIAPHFGFVFPVSFMQIYAGGLVGIDFGWTFWTDMFVQNNKNRSDWAVGGLGGIDFFLAKKFSLGFELQYQRIFPTADINRVVLMASAKWQFGR